MTRQIIFRGYNLRNKKWLYGYYFVNRGQHFICPDGIDINNLLASWEDFVVEEESIGQWTGNKDADGRAIYEGDILWMCYRADALGYVRWRNEYSGFTIQEKGSLRWWNMMFREDKVVGNTYENKRMIAPENWKL